MASSRQVNIIIERLCPGTNTSPPQNAKNSAPEFRRKKNILSSSAEAFSLSSNSIQFNSDDLGDSSKDTLENDSNNALIHNIYVY